MDFSEERSLIQVSSRRLKDVSIFEFYIGGLRVTFSFLPSSPIRLIPPRQVTIYSKS